MSIRIVKQLRLQGRHVGEYLGSDDADEDAAAVRKALDKLGVKGVPLSMSMYGQAASFESVANSLYGEAVRPTRGKPLVVAPFIVNATFGMELCLKTLHLVDSGKQRRGHKLLELFDALTTARRIELQSYAVSVAREHGEGPQLSFRSCLASHNESFEKWRYVYELNQSGRIVPMQIILLIHTLHDVTRRAATGK